MDSDGHLRLASGTGTNGTSYMTLGGGEYLGLDDARRLADLLREAPPPLLTELDLRCLLPPFPLPSFSPPHAHEIAQ